MRVLILSAAYGAGHNSAARALFDEFTCHGHVVFLHDGLELAPSHSYPLIKSFYKFCCDYAGWLWGLTFDQTDRANWSRLVALPLFAKTIQAIEMFIKQESVELVICTYPLFSHMLDYLRKQGCIDLQHVAVVTDAIEVSRPWVRNEADLICLTDEYSSCLVEERYGLAAERLLVSSFPTSSLFAPSALMIAPDRASLRILYAAQAPAVQCAGELAALIRAYPHAQITILAGQRFESLSSFLEAEALSSCRNYTLMKRTDEMHVLMREHHLYIGKPGGATMFECYASAIPMIVNFALMGQEQGNLELLERDGCGCYAQGAESLIATVAYLLQDRAAAWLQMRRAMQSLPRRDGASRIREACEHLRAN